MSDKITLQDVLDDAADAGYVNTEKIDTARDILSGDQEGSAWYIQSLAGCGGWIAAMFFFSFAGCWISLLFADLFDNEPRAFGVVLAIAGALAITTSVVLRRSSGMMTLAQFALAVHIAGQLLVIVGLALWVDPDFTGQTGVIVSLSLIVIGLQFVVIPIYPDALLRSISTGAAVVAANVMVYEAELPAGLSVITALLALGTLVYWGGLLGANTEIRTFPVLRPVAYALPVGMFGTLIYELAEANYINARDVIAVPLLTAIVLLVLTLWAEFRFLHDYDIPLRSSTAYGVLAITVIVALPSLTTPGILAALFVAVLGFRRRESRVRTVAYLFLAGFLIHFYYDLNTTFLIKSIILIATGALMLVGRLVLRRVLPTNPEVNYKPG